MMASVWNVAAHTLKESRRCEGVDGAGGIFISP
jgi:hypothetical protein